MRVTLKDCFSPGGGRVATVKARKVLVVFVSVIGPGIVRVTKVGGVIACVRGERRRRRSELKRRAVMVVSFRFVWAVVAMGDKERRRGRV